MVTLFSVKDVFCVPNALKDPRFADNPLVIGPPDIRFYADAPLTINGTYRIGTLCIIDREPREFPLEQQALLTTQIAVDEAQCLIVHASPRSLSSAIYHETVLTILAEHPMRSKIQSIVIAIPEAVAITHRNMVEKLNHALSAAGGGLMITNYGASASSISVLKQLKPQYVRLDKVLVRRLEKPEYLPADRTLIETTTAANTMIVASGVENARSVSGLWAKGIRCFQGYFIQEPNAMLAMAAEDE